jgi:serine protease inhibitor
VTNSAAYLQKFALLVRDKNRPLKNEYENLLTNTYDATIEDVEFRNIEETLNTINQLVSEKTNGQITNAVIPDDLYRVKIHTLICDKIFN